MAVSLKLVPFVCRTAARNLSAQNGVKVSGEVVARNVCSPGQIPLPSTASGLEESSLSPHLHKKRTFSHGSFSGGFFAFVSKAANSLWKSSLPQTASKSGSFSSLGRGEPSLRASGGAAMDRSDEASADRPARPRSPPLKA